MNVVLWIVQGLLALGFLASGAIKVSQPKDRLAKNMSWVEDFSEPAVKAIGAAEVLGAIGLIVPKATGIAPVLTPIAAIGLAITMVGALVVHVRRKDAAANLVPAAVLLVLSVLVAVGRF